MDDLNAPKINKWPFFIGDLVMVVFASAILVKGPWPLSVTLTALCGVLLLAGGVLSIIPYILEYQAAMRMAESGRLNQTVAQINKLDTLASQIATASGHWQTAQELAEKTTRTAREVTSRMETENKAFQEFMQKAQDSEKSRLQLEIDKLHRSEGEWVQATTAILDHIFALFVAGMRSGQPNLIEQLGQFQNACRDLAHRVGLTAFMPKPNEPFNPEAHQLMNGQTEVEARSVVAQIVATGYTYQGQLIRRAVVTVKSPEAAEAATTTSTTSTTTTASPLPHVPAEGTMPAAEAEGQVDSTVASSEEEEEEKVAEELPETASAEITETESESPEDDEPESATVESTAVPVQEHAEAPVEAPEEENAEKPKAQDESVSDLEPESQPEPEPSVAEEPESESAKPSHPPRPPREQELF